MKKREEYKLVIDAFTPETMPMARLAEYMTDLATLLGERQSVHFVRLEEGSTALIHEIEYEAVPKVRARVNGLRSQDAPPEAMRAFQALDRRLSEDNASATLFQPQGDRVIEFPGRRRVSPLEYGPFNQPGTLDGVPIVIGGESDPVPVHLEDGEVIHICRAPRAIAKKLATHLFVTRVRVNGTARWFRSSEAQWVMRHFHINSFEVLDEAPLREVVGIMRAVPARWKLSEDPLRDLDALRHGPDKSLDDE